MDTRTDAERRYDATALSTRQPAQPAAAYDVMIELVETAAAPEPMSAVETIEAIFDAGEMPSGDQLVDLLNEDELSSYVWWRAIDWVLYRQRNGLPVERLNERDTMPAAIEARFAAERRSRAREHRGAFCAEVTLRRAQFDKWEQNALAASSAQATRPIDITYLHCDERGNVNASGRGEVVYVDYTVGTEDDDQVSIGFSAGSSDDPPDVMLFGFDPVLLDRALRSIASLQELLADPRIKAELERWQATQPTA